MNRKIIIIGSGISGLTIAHELINKGFNVEIYEKSNISGGMARSTRITNNIPTDHSWRGYAPFYHNTYNIMKQIPIYNICHIEKFDNRILTLEEVKKHNTENSLWTIYKNDVYDITEFIDEHPGGRIILSAGGKNLENVWKDLGVEWHASNNHILTHLKKYKIGTLSDQSIERFNGKDTNIYSVYDNLGKELNFNLLRNELTLNEPNKIIDNIDYRDIPYLLYKVIEFESSSDKRRNEFFKIPMKQIYNKLHEKSKIFIKDFAIGPGLGMDYNTASIGHFMIVIGYSFKNRAYWRVMKKPTNEAWIVPWVKYLKKKGVKFYYDYQCQKINFENDNISSVVMETGKEVYNIIGNEYIFAIDPFSYNDILKKSVTGKYQFKNELQNLSKLNTVNNQIGFIIGFNKKFNYQNNNDSFVLVDSPNNITFYPQDLHFCKNINLGKKIKSLWSGTCVISYNNGSLYNKSLTQLNEEEIKKEIIQQFINSNDLLYYISQNNGGHKLNLNDIEIVKIFEDWSFDNKMVSKNLKWVNTYYNEDYRPCQKTNINNMYLTGAHTKTSINVWSMEGAVESGKITSNMILEKYGLSKTYLYTHSSLWLFKIFQLFDILLFMIGLPNFNIIHVIIIFLILFMYNRILVRRNKRKKRT